MSNQYILCLKLIIKFLKRLKESLHLQIFIACILIDFSAFIFTSHVGKKNKLKDPFLSKSICQCFSRMAQINAFQFNTRQRSYSIYLEITLSKRHFHLIGYTLAKSFNFN